MEKKINTLITSDELMHKAKGQSALLNEEIKNNFIIDFNAAALSAVEKSEDWFNIYIAVPRNQYSSLNSFLKDVVLIYYPWITHQGYIPMGLDSGSTEEKYYHVIRMVW